MIPYFVPYIGKKEEKALKDAISAGNIHGDGRICRAVENRFRRTMKARSVFLTTSGTHALELALMVLGIKKGDEVICPSFTFVSTANAIMRQGAKPVFAEIEKDTLNIDIDDVLKRITRKTRAIIPVHYAGFSCDIERLVKVAAKKKIPIIEDAAQAVGAKYNGRHLGTFGDLGCISFHSTKNITSGEGGAIVINRKKLDKNTSVMREKGTNRSLFMEGKIKKYTWVGVGSSFVMSDVLAALLSAQLENLPFINRKKRSIFRMYERGLRGLEKKGLITLPHPDKKSYGNGHIFWILLGKGTSRARFMEDLKKKGIECTHHYVPLHSSPFGIARLGYKRNDFPVTEEVSERLVRLPVHAYLSDKDVNYIIETITDLLRGRINNAGKNRS